MVLSWKQGQTERRSRIDQMNNENAPPVGNRLVEGRGWKVWSRKKRQQLAGWRGRQRPEGCSWEGACLLPAKLSPPEVSTGKTAAGQAGAPALGGVSRPQRGRQLCTALLPHPPLHPNPPPRPCLSDALASMALPQSQPQAQCVSLVNGETVPLSQGRTEGLRTRVLGQALPPTATRPETATSLADQG